MHHGIQNRTKLPPFRYSPRFNYRLVAPCRGRRWRHAARIPHFLHSHSQSCELSPLSTTRRHLYGSRSAGHRSVFKFYIGDLCTCNLQCSQCKRFCFETIVINKQYTVASDKVYAFKLFFRKGPFKWYDRQDAHTNISQPAEAFVSYHSLFLDNNFISALCFRTSS